MYMKISNSPKLIICLAVPQFAGFVGTLFTRSEIRTWYDTLAQSPLTPPNWTFGVVWTILYILMGVSAFLIWRKGFNKKHVKSALGIFILQLVMNTLWSILFFGLHNPAAALLDIISLWLAIVATMIAFSSISKHATWLLVPYLLWVSFATYLNYYIWAFN
jgi:tryptophan-rich sensory protein